MQYNLLELHFFSKVLFLVDKMHIHLLKDFKTFKKCSEKLNNHYYIYSYIGIWFCFYSIQLDGKIIKKLVKKKKTSPAELQIFFLQLCLTSEETTQTCAISSYSYVLFKNVSVSLRPETLCNPCTDDNNVSARWRDELGCSFPSCLPETPHQWMELVLHISKTRSIVLSLQFVILHVMSKGSSKFTVSGIVSSESLTSP